jgi:hypothetical protein
MGRPVQMHVQPHEVDSRLRRLGLTETIIREAIRAGELERASCTSLNPRPYPGVAAWSWTVATFRQQTIPQGWRIEDKNNLPLTIDPVRHTAIVITSGSAATGDPKRMPTTKYPKGRMTAGQVKINQRQLTLLFADKPKLVPTPHRSELFTWLLLIRPEYDPKRERFLAHFELSLPAAIDQKGFVTEWEERIIFTPVILDDIVLGKPDNGPDGGRDAEDIDIPVKRK